MENQTLIQKNGFEKKIFTLETDYVKVKTSKLGEKWEFKVSYDQIGFETMNKTDMKNKYAPHAFSGFIVLNIFLVANTVREAPANMYAQLGFWAFCLALFGSFFALSLIGRKKEYVYLTGGEKTLELFNNKPDRATVQEFIEKIYQHIRTLQKEKYLQMVDDNLNLPIDMHTHLLNHLVNIKAITKEEREQFLGNLKKSGNNPIGFQMSGN